METNITINAIELASNLAHEKLMQYYEDLQDNRDFEFPNGVKIETEDEIIYTEEAQDLFNEFYEEFLTMIEECKIS